MVLAPGAGARVGVLLIYLEESRVSVRSDSGAKSEGRYIVEI